MNTLLALLVSAVRALSKGDSRVASAWQTVDDGSAGCNNYTLLLLDWLAHSSIPDLLSSVLFSRNGLTETSGCRE